MYICTYTGSVQTCAYTHVHTCIRCTFSLSQISMFQLLLVDNQLMLSNLHNYNCSSVGRVTPSSSHTLPSHPSPPFLLLSFSSWFRSFTRAMSRFQSIPKILRAKLYSFSAEVCLSVYLSVLARDLSIYLSVLARDLSVYLCVLAWGLSVYLSVLAWGLSVCLSVCLGLRSVCPTVPLLNLVKTKQLTACMLLFRSSVLVTGRIILKVGLSFILLFMQEILDLKLQTIS